VGHPSPAIRLRDAFFSTMGYKKSQKSVKLEIELQKAISAYRATPEISIRAIAHAFKVPRTTLARRLRDGVSRFTAHQTQQILTNAEESTLIRWIKRYTIAGTPLTPSLLKDLAQHLRHERVRFASSQRPPVVSPDTIGHEWLYRFLNRHQEIRGIYARQMEYARLDGATQERVKRWFNAVEAKFAEHAYDLSNVWNMDESGFGVGEEQASRVLIYLDKIQRHKAVLGKQEWISDIECINAAGESLPPLLIFKGRNLNTRWIPANTPQDWHFAISKNGWTSNEIGLQWLIKVFEPLTREKAAGRQRLLIADGHGSHIQANFIAYCMENDIDLLILPPHCSHVLQPLDVGVFAAFKRRYTGETAAISRLSSQRISRAEWVQLFARARESSVIRENILAGWRAAGISPLNPRRVLKDLPSEADSVPIHPYTPPERAGLDLSLLKSSPPEPVELSQSNKRFTETLRECNDVVSPVKRYAERMTRLCESQNATIAIMSKQLAEQSELLHKRKRATKGKRVRLEGVTVYSTPDVLRVAGEAEATPIAKRPRGRPRKTPIEPKLIESEDSIASSSSDNLDREISPRRRYATRSQANRR
jgi:DDE superfamily endonuclease/Tc5 transposase DNA-binding domain